MQLKKKKCYRKHILINKYPCNIADVPTIWKYKYITCKLSQWSSAENVKYYCMYKHCHSWTCG